MFTLLNSFLLTSSLHETSFSSSQVSGLSSVHTHSHGLDPGPSTQLNGGKVVSRHRKSRLLTKTNLPQKTETQEGFFSFPSTEV